MNLLFPYLTFSDSAKYYEAAKNLASIGKSVIHHSFFDRSILNQPFPPQSFPVDFLPLPTWVMSQIFRFLPPTDSTVITTGLFLFLFTAVLIFFLGKKIYSFKAGIITAILFITNPPLIEYATNFTSETHFIFLSLLFIFLLTLPGMLKLVSLLPLVLLFFTRQQAAIFLLSIIISALILLFRSSLTKTKKLKITAIIFIIVLFLLNITIQDISSIFSPAKIIGTFSQGTNISPATYLRGEPITAISPHALVSKVFYNLYNFAKSPERVVHPVILTFFILGLFLKPLSAAHQRLKIFTLTLSLLFILAAAATLPNARYLHPLLPFIMLISVISILEIFTKLKLRAFGQVILMLILIGLTSLPAIGHFTLDARFRQKTSNISQPPVYRKIASIMAENIPKEQLIITNLDAWAAWYEGLTTMWFPLSPTQLEGYQDKIKYIVITNYKEHDGDFTLGNWYEVVYSAQNIKNDFLSTNYQLLTTFKINPEQVYENQSYQGTILVRRESL